MNKLLTLVLISIVLVSFKWQDDKEKIACFDLKFKSYQEQADSLISFMNQAIKCKSTEDKEFERKFFCTFPNSFEEMKAIFGYSSKDGASPLYSSDNQSGNYLNKRIFSDVIGFFSELESIPDSVYYKKYININISGYWEADNIRGAFGFHSKLLNDTEGVCPTLSKYTDKEIKSVFRFIFDGPHPKNDTNEKIYNQLRPKIEKENKRLAKLLAESYNQLMEEDDGH